ncbi:MAG: LysR family transcriptional regulator [Reyranellaceae bacterium]
MHLSRIDLNLFVAFDAIYAEGSITRASARLNLSQPALSHALGRLRRLLGDPLFVRQGSQMVATPVAHGLVPAVREALQRFEATVNRASRFEPATARKHFTVGLRNHLEPELLPRLVRAIAAEAPGVTLGAVRAERRELERSLSGGRLDVALDVLLPLSGEVQRRQVATEQLVVMARSGHPAVGRVLTLATYLSQGHVQVSSRPGGPSVEDFEISRLGGRRDVRLRCQHYAAACRVVSESDLLLTLPERYARPPNPTFGNRVLAFPARVPAFQTFLYWHKNADGDPANAWLRTLIAAAFSPADRPRIRRGSAPGSGRVRR